MRVRITRRAAAHIDQATGWWTRNRPLAPGALEEDYRVQGDELQILALWHTRRGTEPQL